MPGLASNLQPWPENDASRHGDEPQLVLPLGSTWSSPLPLYIHVQLRSEEFWTLYARKYGLFHPIESIGYAQPVTIEDDYTQNIDIQWRMILPPNFTGYLSPVSVIKEPVHGFLKPSKRTFAEYLSLDQDGRVDKTITLQHRLDRFLDAFNDINSIMRKGSKSLMDFAWIFVYVAEKDDDDDFDKWLDNWNDSLNKLIKSLDATLHNFDLCVYRFIIWETAIQSSLYFMKYHDIQISHRRELESWSSNLLKLIQSLAVAAGQRDSNLARYYQYSIDQYWTTRAKLSPQSDYTAENELDTQRNKADLESRLKKVQTLAENSDFVSCEPLCNELLNCDLGVTLNPSIRGEVCFILSKCTHIDKNERIKYAKEAIRAFGWVESDSITSDQTREWAINEQMVVKEFMDRIK